MGYRLALLASMLWLVSCASGANPGDKGDAKGQGQPARSLPRGGQGEPASRSASPALVPVPLAPDPLGAGLESSDWPAGDESPRPGEEGPVLDMAPPDEGPRSLLERLTSMYGVRVPLGNTHFNLDGIVGSAPLTVPLSRSPASGVSEFAREIIVSVSKRELFVNDYRVGEVVCTTASGRPCEEQVDSGEAVRYHVRELEVADGHFEALVVPALLKQLQYFQKGRGAVLSVLGEKASAWLMECDAYTLAVDRDIPFGIVATLIHTAGFADLTMARLAVVDENDSLNYVPLPSPRLDRTQRRMFHLLGDEWWRGEQAKQTVDFPWAWLAYSASLHAETFSGLEDSAIPACLPSDVMWDRAVEDSEYGRQVAKQILEHANRVVSEHPVLFGRQPPSPLVPGLHPTRLEGGEAGDEDARTADIAAGRTDEADVRAASVSADAGEAPPFPPNRVVPQPEAGVPAVDGDGAGRETATSSLLGPVPLLPQVFLQGAGFRVVLRVPDGTVMTAVDVPLSEPDRLYHYLAQASGHSVLFSASWDTPMEKVVAALDLLRYRCSVYAMSGRCRQWTPVLPHVLLFAVPGDRFLPRPAEVSPGASGDAGASAEGAAPSAEAP